MQTLMCKCPKALQIQTYASWHSRTSVIREKEPVSPLLLSPRQWQPIQPHASYPHGFDLRSAEEGGWREAVT